MEDIKEESTIEEIQEEINEEKSEETQEEVVETKKEKKSKAQKRIEELEEKVKELEANLEAQVNENASLTDKLLRNAAEVENFKKRIQDERVKERKYASISLVGDLIQPLEYLNLSVNMQTEDQMLKNFLMGFQMINKQIFDVLEKDGLKAIECNVGDEFNPNLHHAIETTEDENYPVDSIVQVMQRGYMYKDRILRPTMVKVNKEKKEND